MEKEVIYRRTLRQASDANDGETPTLLQVIHTPMLTRPYTLEFSSEDGAAVLGTGWDRYSLIETAVKFDAAKAEALSIAIAEIINGGRPA